MNEKKLLENLDSMSIYEILDIIDKPDISISEETQVKLYEKAAHLTTLRRLERGELKRIEDVYEDFLRRDNEQ